MSDEKRTNKRGDALPTEGFAVAVDSKIKFGFDTLEEAIKVGSQIKQKFPVVKVAIYDAKQGTRTPVELPEEPA